MPGNEIDGAMGGKEEKPNVPVLHLMGIKFTECDWLVLSHEI